MSHSRKQLCVAVVLILALLIPLWPAFEKAATVMDEGTLLVYPELILKGAVPYRDFETFYGPANLWILAGAYASFGTNIFVERAVGLLYRVLILAAIFALIRRWNTTLAAGCLFLSGFFILPMTVVAYAWLGAIMCALWSLYLLARTESNWRIFCSGLLAGCALLYRADLAPAVVISALPFFLTMKSPGRWRYLAGAALGVLPLVWLTIAAGPMQILNNFFLFPVLHCSAGRRLPIITTDQALVCVFFAHLIATFVNVAAGAVAVRADKNDIKARLFLAVALLGLGLSHQAAQRLDRLHVVFAAFLSLGLLPLSIFILRTHWLKLKPSRAHALLTVAMVVILVQALVPELVGYFRSEVITSMAQRPANTYFLDQHGRPFPFSSKDVAITTGKLLQDLEKHSLPGERLFVGPSDLRRTNCNDTYLYYMMPKLIPASYFLEMNPMSANRPGSRLASDVATADWLILSHSWDDWSEPNESMLYRSDAPSHVVDNQFQLRGHYGDYDLYQRKTAGIRLGSIN